MKEIFPEVKGTPGDETVFVASKSAQVVSLDSEVLKARYGALSKPPFDPAGFDTLVPPHRTAFVAKELERSPRLINTDFDPISSSLAMILWGKFSGTAHLEVLNTLRRGGMKAYLIPLALFVVARICFRARWGPRDGQEARFQALLAMAAAGTAAMGLQIVLIYAYQSLFGYIFERIGLIAAFFMAGLVLGGFFGGELVFRVRNKAVLTALVLAAFSLLCLVTSPGLKLAGTLEPWLIELVVFAMVVVSGILTGAAFPVAASRHLEIGGNAGETSGWTDAADHFGAAIGAIITGTLLVPLLGMTHACLLLAVVVAVPAILIGSEFVFHRIDPILERLRPHPRPSFPYIRLSWLLAFCVTAAFLWGLLIGPPGSSPLVQFPEEMLKKVSGSEAFQFKEDPFPHYVGTSPGEAGFTVSLSTMPTSRTVRGYGGPINVLLSVSDRGIIKGLSVVESRETPSYIKGMDKWLEGFRGRSVLKPLQGEIDAMTGATISSRAIIEAVQGTGKKIAEPLLGLREVETAAAPKPRGRDLLTDARLWSVVLLMILFTYAFYSRSRRIRLGCLFASLLVLGIYLNAPFTCLEAAGIIRGEIPASGTIWRNALFVGVVLISVFWGQAFCGFLCPFGAVQEFLSVKKLRLRPTAAVERAGRYCKFVLLGVLLCLFLVTDDTIWFSFDPLQHFFADHTRDFFLGRMDTWILGLCLAGLLASIFYFRFWCRYLCPAGAFLALANKIALLRKYAPTPIPGRCDLGVASTHDVDCIQCHRCLEK
jgi:hypothetical protein